MQPGALLGSAAFHRIEETSLGLGASASTAGTRTTLVLPAFSGLDQSGNLLMVLAPFLQALQDALPKLFAGSMGGDSTVAAAISETA